MEIIWKLVSIAGLVAFAYGIWLWISMARHGQDERVAKFITGVGFVIFFVSVKSIIGTLIAAVGMSAIIYGSWRLTKKRPVRSSLLVTIIGLSLFMMGAFLVGPSSILQKDAARSTQTSAEAKSSTAEEESAAKAEYESLRAEESSSRSEAAESSSLEKTAAESSAAASSSIAQAEQEAASSSQAAAPQNTNDQQLVYITATGSKYHFNRGCRVLRNANSVSTMSLSDATAQGLTKCGFE